MTNREALEIAKRENSLAIHISECSMNPGLRKIYGKKSDWLTLLIWLAEAELRRRDTE